MQATATPHKPAAYSAFQSPHMRTPFCAGYRQAPRQPAICGTHLGTKLATSIRENPARDDQIHPAQFPRTGYSRVPRLQPVPRRTSKSPQENPLIHNAASLPVCQYSPPDHAPGSNHSPSRRHGHKKIGQTARHAHLRQRQVAKRCLGVRDARSAIPPTSIAVGVSWSTKAYAPFIDSCCVECMRVSSPCNTTIPWKHVPAPAIIFSSVP